MVAIISDAAPRRVARATGAGVDGCGTPRYRCASLTLPVIRACRDRNETEVPSNPTARESAKPMIAANT